MNIEVFRVDDRLIHGQIVVGWLPAFDITRIVVVNDKVLADRSRREMMALAVMQGQKVEFLGVKEAAGVLASDTTADRTLVLFESPADALGFVKGGGVIGVLNVGGLHHAKGKREIHSGYYVADEDVAALHELVALGVALQIQALPGPSFVDLNALLAKEKT
jgi:fructose PTS system EIIB component